LIHHPSLTYQDFAVLPASQFDAIRIFLAGNERVKTMSLESMRLRLESSDDSPAKEFRIEYGNIEVRTLNPGADLIDGLAVSGGGLRPSN
jgi:hypothetical protein